MSQHTPWFVNPAFKKWNDSGVSSTAPYAIVTATGEPVLSTSEWLHVEDADLLKMAAAPDLLAALEKMVEWDEREKDHAIDFYDRLSLCDEAFSMMRAAIKKARGE